MDNPHSFNALNQQQCHSQVGMFCSPKPNTLSQMAPHDTCHRSTVWNPRHCPRFHVRSSGPHAGELSGHFCPEHPGCMPTLVGLVKKRFELSPDSNQPFVFLSSPDRLTPTPLRTAALATTISCALLDEPPARRPGANLSVGPISPMRPLTVPRATALFTLPTGGWAGSSPAASRSQFHCTSYQMDT